MVAQHRTNQMIQRLFSEFARQRSHQRIERVLITQTIAETVQHPSRDWVNCVVRRFPEVSPQVAEVASQLVAGAQLVEIHGINDLSQAEALHVGRARVRKSLVPEHLAE